jgi:hypothetical protein
MGGTITNENDVNRVWPSTALARKMLTELEGAFIEKITGPTNGGTVELSHPVYQLVHIFAYVTATGAWPGANPPNPIEGTDFDVTPSNANGKGALVEKGVADRSAETWVVLYRRPEPEGTIGGQSSI